MPRANLNSDTIIRAAADAADAAETSTFAMSVVARSLGVQTASLYGHVTDRAAVLDGVRELALDEVSDLIGAAIAGRAGRDALEGLAVAQRAYGRDHPGRWAALLRPFSHGGPASSGEVRLRALSLAVLHGYRIAGDELVHATRLVDSTINGFVDLERTGILGQRSEDPEVSWRRILNSLDAILGSWSETAMAGSPS